MQRERHQVAACITSSSRILSCQNGNLVELISQRLLQECCILSPNFVNAVEIWKDGQKLVSYDDMA